MGAMELHARRGKAWQLMFMEVVYATGKYG